MWSHVRCSPAASRPPSRTARGSTSAAREAIRETLEADDRFDFLSPTEWGTAPIEAVHNPGLVKFLEEGWRLYAAAHPGVREVVAGRVLPTGTARQDGDRRRTGEHQRSGRLLVLRDDHSAHRGHLRRRPWCGRHCADDDRAGPLGRRACGLRTVPPARPPCADRPLRWLLLLQQRRRRRPSRGVHHGHEGDGARRRLPPRQRHPADLLRPRRRPVRVAPRRPGTGLPVLGRASPTRPAAAAAWAATSTTRCRCVPTTTATSPRWRACASDRRVRPVDGHRLARSRHVHHRPDQ